MPSPLSSSMAPSVHDLYVSPAGNDSWSGALSAPNADGTDGPLATLARARDVMRAGGADTTWVHGGTYRLDQTLVLDERDSGHAFKAVPGETPVLSGGEAVRGFTAEAGGLFAAPLATPNGLDLTIDGVRQRVAQTGAFDPAHPHTSGWRVLKQAQGGPSASQFTFKDTDIPADLTAKPGMVVQSFDYERLSDGLSALQGIDHVSDTITLATPNYYTLRDGGTYRLLNDASLIQGTGEFAWRDDDHKLVVKPTSPDTFQADAQADGVVVARLDTLVRLERAADVTLSGLTFSDTVWDGAAVSLQGGHNNLIGGDHFLNVGTAVKLDGSTGNRVAGNLMEHLGDSGVTLGFAADGNAIYDNQIEHIGEIHKGGGAIAGVGASRTLVAHNDIADSARYGISFKDWDGIQMNQSNVILGNLIRHTGQDTADGAAIELLGRSGRLMNAVISGNRIEDSGGLATASGSGAFLEHHKGWGISLDDMSSGVAVRDNFIAGASWADIYFHGGDHNLAENNFGLIATPTDAFIRVEWVPKAGVDGKPQDNRVIHNLIAAAQPMERYWELLTTGQLTLDHNATRNTQTYGLHDVIVDPHFADPAADDYRLTRPEALAAIGIHDLSWAAMGRAGFTAAPDTPIFW